MTRALFAFALSAFAAATAAGCHDPVHDDLISTLGGEDPNVPAGPLHRPGQPCLACHDSGGPASLQFATAGTVFQDAKNVFPDAIPMAGATVTFTDANGLVLNTQTNCAGNFYVEHADWVAIGVAFPIHMGVAWRNQSTAMLSHMGKETSCAQCHVYAVPATADMAAMAGMPTPSNVGQIYLTSDPLTPPPPACP